ncbi:MAG: hypothetical protein ACT443_11435 [Gemmatimonadota bacterium]
MPASDRDYYDFVRLAPGLSGVSARTGISGGGVGIRFNSFLIDGVSDRGLPGNLAAGTGAGGKAIPIDAVKEYEVLLSPFDPRYGDFAGVVINAITRSGTNDRTAMAFVYRRDRL